MLDVEGSNKDDESRDVSEHERSVAEDVSDLLQSFGRPKTRKRSPY